MKQKLQNLRVAGKRFAARTGTALAITGATIGTALASGGSEFDPQTVVTKVLLYAGFALVIILAFASAIWGLRAAGLIGGKR